MRCHFEIQPQLGTLVNGDAQPWPTARLVISACNRVQSLMNPECGYSPRSACVGEAGTDLATAALVRSFGTGVDLENHPAFREVKLPLAEQRDKGTKLVANEREL
ncbi:hypothetical protein ALP85_200003 [Pseudomonas syringae pv. syringae]|nr:hypothetical protein ALP85_200003 [Pseudomonas syringae pv. syringae]